MRTGRKRSAAAASVKPGSSSRPPEFSVAFDLGSNTLRAVKRDCKRGEFVADFERIVRTADGLTETGEISRKAVERIVAALQEAEKRIEPAGAVCRAVATEALRRAANGREVLRELERRTGVRFEIVGGEEEAGLTLLAVRKRLQNLGREADAFVLADIGGGSTELVFVGGGKVLSRSFPLGIVTLSQEAGTLENIERLLPEKLAAMKSFVAGAAEMRERPKMLVATAGTPTTVAAMKLGMEYGGYDAGRINGMKLRKEELRVHLKRLFRMSRAEREKAVGAGRDDLIAAGILIFEGIFDVTGFDECLVVDDGLREGVALRLCGESF